LLVSVTVSAVLVGNGGACWWRGQQSFATLASKSQQAASALSSVKVAVHWCKDFCLRFVALAPAPAVTVVVP